MDIEIVIEISMFEALYDFIIVYGVWHEKADKQTLKRYHIIQWIVDIFVVLPICYFMLDVNLLVLGVFVFYKLLHGCDSFYNIYKFMLTNEPAPVNGDWRWWTPLGLWRTLLESWHYKRFIPANVTIRETWIQNLIGLIISFIILTIYN